VKLTSFLSNGKIEYSDSALFRDDVTSERSLRTLRPHIEEELFDAIPHISAQNGFDRRGA
jgi:hypothetical protein